MSTSNQQALPCLHIADGNEAAVLLWEEIRKETGLDFKPHRRGMQAQAERPEQIVQLLIVLGGVKVHRYDNDDWPNTLMIKRDHHYGFYIDSICYACVEYHGLPTHSMTPEERLSC
jgi:hypothetical protein